MVTIEEEIDQVFTNKPNHWMSIEFIAMQIGEGMSRRRDIINTIFKSPYGNNVIYGPSLGVRKGSEKDLESFSHLGGKHKVRIAHR